ncbi:transporter substrate-binding domain-containing protein [Duganella sp. LX20W]|uniref:Transporter substrate-binding domain-containing protein n=1 Tax=Rugamonas brunnea TaxID=2758569 RepID=A0A7W2EPM2_9BURK|nr:transporter substrate-binding domain-containing protein [Rugamonas brunnea]MBA5636124.1 transporter substrate-binding domain-containing protein [Rugamonas brunnea]
MMRRRTWRLWLSCIALLLPAAARADALVIAINDWCPYSCSAEGSHRGILVDIVNDIFTAAGSPPHFVQLPFARALSSVRSGQAQAIVGVTHAVAPDLQYPDEPIITTQFCFFTRPESTWRYTSGGELGAVRVGVGSGKKFPPGVERALQDATRVPGGTDLIWRMVRMLDIGRLDAVLEEHRTLPLELAQRGHAPLRNAGCIDSNNEYVAFQPGSAYARIFSEGMRNLRKSGRMAQIYAQYGVN